jgi:hypothetical protein
MSDGGKGGGGGEQHNYHGTIAAAFCHGPVDGLRAIEVEGKTVWPTAEDWSGASVAYPVGTLATYNGEVWQCLSSHVSSVGTPPAAPVWKRYALLREHVAVNPVVVDVAGFGSLILYWGTEDQTLDAGSEPTFAAAHPDYKGVCVGVFKDWLFGLERVTPPSVSLVLLRNGVQEVFPTSLDDEGQANPLGIIAEAATSTRWGLGMPPGSVDLAAFASTAEALAAKSGKTFLSPVLSRDLTFGAIVEETLGYVDGWARWDENGRITIGLYHDGGGPPPFGPDKTVSKDDLESEPEMTSEGWGMAPGSAAVKFNDRQRSWKERVEQSNSVFRFADSEETLTLDAPWITRGAQAATHAAEAVRRAGIEASGTLRCVGPKVQLIEPGSQFRLVHEVSGVDTVCRCVEKTTEGPGSDVVVIRFEVERAFSPEVYQIPSEETTPASAPAPEVVSLYRFVSFVDGSGARLALLAARTDPTTVRARVHMRQADGSAFYELGTQGNWCVTGTLQQAYSSAVSLDDDSEAFRVTLDGATNNTDLSRILETQTADAVEDTALAAFVFDGSGAFEVFSVKAARVVGVETFYRFKVKRARFGTSRLSFSTGHRVFIGYRREMPFYTHASFAGFSAAGTTATFRIQPRNIWRESDLSDAVACPDRTHTFGAQFCSIAADAAASATTWRALTDAATVTWAADPAKTIQQAAVTIAGNRTLAIAGATNGMRFQLRVTQGGAGSNTLALPAGSKVAGGGGGAVVLSTAAGSVDLLEAYFDGTNYFWSLSANYT